ncbi:PepSY domain-containing protein [Hydrogenophaga sp. YM1]|uniref:PepSY domain-containing protein n=1 Tax=unclassified Hydrogenophaga TaxID=2610897 RepID=UPI001956A9F2|nr:MULTISPECIES: PepSY domain-containing protein [unclassified Hydrogenophaga]MBN9372672.1 PepSY domain-containing protein [Hydrogenophaga sp.]QRR34192.1 PepSY domain-containing protein [Hydrogenophaga sp. YM1]
MKALAIAIATTTLALFAAGNALASPTCAPSKEGWKPEADFKKDLQAQGYQIKTFKVTKGNCYEIYGHDKAGKKVEIYFDPVSGKPVKSQ